MWWKALQCWGELQSWVIISCRLSSSSDPFTQSEQVGLLLRQICICWIASGQNCAVVLKDLMSLSDTRFSPWPAWKVFSQQPTILLEAVESGLFYRDIVWSVWVFPIFTRPVNIYNLQSGQPASAFKRCKFVAHYRDAALTDGRWVSSTLKQNPDNRMRYFSLCNQFMCFAQSWVSVNAESRKCVRAAGSVCRLMDFQVGLC